MRLALPICLLAPTLMLAADYPEPAKLPQRAGLPNPLVMLNGDKVTTPKEWADKGVPELKGLFQHYMYGRWPDKPTAVTGKVLFEDGKAFGGKGTLREVEVTFGPPEWPKLYLLIAIPNGRDRACACFVGPNFNGNHTLLADERSRVPTAWTGNGPGVKDNHATAAGRGKEADVWPLEAMIARGYAVATFHAADLQPDRPGVAEGMRATGEPVASATGGVTKAGSETGTVMWWGWGISRAVDYLTGVKEIDGKRLAAVGHSRLGKATLVAGAFDDRIALVIPHQAGCGGSAPSRTDNPKAEPVKRINTSFPHWFCERFKAFGDDPSRLPFDQNCLVALCAPRPVLFTNATEDEWANPRGQFEVLAAATPVYQLLGVEGLTAKSMPAEGEIISSRLGYWIRPGKHAMTPADWKTFADYADRWLK